ncbi:RpiB/LacA/LacB family sugar-phosphate isomerase [Candidatus Daviesbacteria bacterium]|nr:RpiB/LacA/LacB family sugar-phosphate isomerase [Candidatus Daviesbacteria bacterium]
MKVYLATDHAGFELKEKVKHFLSKEEYEVEDCGAYAYDKDDDYPDFISKAAEAVSKDPTSKGIIFGSSGQGEAVVANKFKNIRAVVFYTPCIPSHNVDVTGRVSTDPFEMIRLTREHNDANVLSLGAKILNEEDAIKAVRLWLEAPFTNEPRHLRRIEKIKRVEDNLHG